MKRNSAVQILVAVALSLAGFVPCSADLIKVIDVHGKTIISPVDGWITFQPDGRFALNTSARFGPARPPEIFDLDGRPISTINDSAATLDLPPGSRIEERKGNYLIIDGPDGTIGVCSKSGRVILPPNYFQVFYVGDDMFVASIQHDGGTKEYMLFDERGSLVAHLPDWTRVDCNQYHEGLLRIGYDKISFIDKQGRVVIKPELKGNAQDFSEGLSAISYSTDNVFYAAYIDRAGKIVIGPFKNGAVNPFVDGVGIVTVYSPDGKKSQTGSVNTSGKFVSPLGDYDSLIVFFRSTLLGNKDGKKYFLHSNGNVIAKLPDDCTTVQQPPKLDSNTWIACGFGGTKKREHHIGMIGSRWGYCDIHGNVKLKGDFVFCTEFTGDLATAYVSTDPESDLDWRCGVIDRQGNWVVKPEYGWIGIATNNRFIVPEELKDEIHLWESTVDRSRLFGQWLTQNNFVGSTKHDVEVLFGNSPEVCKRNQPPATQAFGYSLTPGPVYCGNAISVLEFGLDENGKVVGWHVVGCFGADQVPWITENVVLQDPRYGLGLGNLLPKEETKPSSN